MMMVNMTLIKMNEHEMAKQKNMMAAVRELSRKVPNLNLFSNMVKQVSKAATIEWNYDMFACRIM